MFSLFWFMFDYFDCLFDLVWLRISFIFVRFLQNNQIDINWLHLASQSQRFLEDSGCSRCDPVEVKMMRKRLYLLLVCEFMFVEDFFLRIVYRNIVSENVITWWISVVIWGGETSAISLFIVFAWNACFFAANVSLRIPLIFV